MKRSEMIDAIKGDLARMDLDFLHGRNLDKIPYHVRVEMITTYVLSFAERYGILPPPSNFNIHTVDKQLGFVAEVTYDFPINEDNSVNLWEPEE